MACGDVVGAIPPLEEAEESRQLADLCGEGTTACETGDLATLGQIIRPICMLLHANGSPWASYVARTLEPFTALAPGEGGAVPFAPGAVEGMGGTEEELLAVKYAHQRGAPLPGAPARRTGTEVLLGVLDEAIAAGSLSIVAYIACRISWLFGVPTTRHICSYDRTMGYCAACDEYGGTSTAEFNLRQVVSSSETYHSFARRLVAAPELAIRFLKALGPNGPLGGKGHALRGLIEARVALVPYGALPAIDPVSGGEEDGSGGEEDGSGGEEDGSGGEEDGSGGEEDGSGGEVNRLLRLLAGDLRVLRRGLLAEVDRVLSPNDPPGSCDSEARRALRPELGRLLCQLPRVDGYSATIRTRQQLGKILSGLPARIRLAARIARAKAQPTLPVGNATLIVRALAGAPPLDPEAFPPEPQTGSDDAHYGVISLNDDFSDPGLIEDFLAKGSGKALDRLKGLRDSLPPGVASTLAPLADLAREVLNGAGDDPSLVTVGLSFDSREGTVERLQCLLNLAEGARDNHYSAREFRAARARQEAELRARQDAERARQGAESIRRKQEQLAQLAATIREKPGLASWLAWLGFPPAVHEEVAEALLSLAVVDRLRDHRLSEEAFKMLGVTLGTDGNVVVNRVDSASSFQRRQPRFPHIGARPDVRAGDRLKCGTWLRKVAANPNALEGPHGVMPPLGMTIESRTAAVVDLDTAEPEQIFKVMLERRGPTERRHLEELVLAVRGTTAAWLEANPVAFVRAATRLPADVAPGVEFRAGELVGRTPYTKALHLALARLRDALPDNARGPGVVRLQVALALHSRPGLARRAARVYAVGAELMAGEDEQLPWCLHHSNPRSAYDWALANPVEEEARVAAFVARALPMAAGAGAGAGAPAGAGRSGVGPAARKGIDASSWRW